MSNLKNPMRFRIKNREIDIKNLLRNEDLSNKQIDKIEIYLDNIYVHWSEVNDD